jgi:hypothetical protein
MKGERRIPNINGIEFIGPDLEAFEDERYREVLLASDLPKPYSWYSEVLPLPSLPKPYRRDNPIWKHLFQASIGDSEILTRRNHINPASLEQFKCISYYSEDQPGIASSSKEEFGYLATLSTASVRQFIKISSKIGTALDRWKNRSITQPKLERDPQLDALLEGNSKVSESEALEIISNWPSPFGEKQIDLGSYTIFYDMIRLIWLHEWAHALCGHLTFVKMELGLDRLQEFSMERAGTDSNKKLPFPRENVMQALEIHADAFATTYCVNGILQGYDPMATIAGRTINLVDRLFMFNVACCLFTVIWSLAERKFAPEDTFYPPPSSTTLSQITKSTHPPAALRYSRFRHFQRELTVKYGFQLGGQYADLNISVDAVSLRFIGTLGEISGYFPSVLLAVTPFIASTPTMKRLDDYEKQLDEIGNTYLRPKLEKLCYLPTSTT